MRRRALLRAVGVGAGTLALSGTGRSLRARPESAGYVPADRKKTEWSPIQDASEWEAVPSRMRTLHDVYVRGDYAYCCYWDAGVWIVDVSDPTDPSLVSRVGDYELAELTEIASDDERTGSEFGEAPGNAHYAIVDEEETVLAVGAEGWDDPDTDVRGVGGIDLYDVTDVEEPEELASIEPPEAADETRGGTWVTAHNFDVRGDRLYSSWYQAGVKIHDISDPANPEQLAWWRRPDETSFWTAKLAQSGEFFVATSMSASDGEAGLYTFPDRAGQQPDPPSLTEDGTSTDDGRVRPSGARAPVAEDYEPLGFVAIEGATEVVVDEDGETAYVAATDGFAVLDVSDPADPAIVFEDRDLLSDRDDGPLDGIQDVKVDGDTLVVAGPANFGRPRGVLVYDVSDSANPEQRGPFVGTSHGNHNVFVQDDYVYLTGNDGRENPLVIVDVSDPSQVSTPETTTDTGPPILPLALLAGGFLAVLVLVSLLAAILVGTLLLVLLLRRRSGASQSDS